MPPFQKKFRKTQLKLWKSPSSRAKRWTHQGRFQFREQTSLNTFFMSQIQNTTTAQIWNSEFLFGYSFWTTTLILFIFELWSTNLIPSFLFSSKSIQIYSSYRSEDRSDRRRHMQMEEQKDFFLLLEGPDPGSRIRIRNITWSYETRLQRQGKNTFHINKFCSLWNLVKSVNWWQGGQSVWSIKLGFARTCTLQHMRISVYYYLIQNQFDLAVHGQPNFYSVHGRHLKYLFITSSLLHTIDPCVRVENE